MPIISGSLLGSITVPKTRPVIGYDNLFLETGTFVDTGSNYEQALNYHTYNGWLTGAAGATFTFTATGAAEFADYFAFAAHDLHLYNGHIKLEYHDGSAWQIAAEIAPGTGDPFMLLFTSVSSNQWRVVVTCTSACTIGVVFAGERLTFERGFHVGHEPAGFGHNYKVLNSTTEGGQYAGQAIQRVGAQGQINLEWITNGWMRTYWEPFITHAESKPWFLMWSSEVYTTEVAYARIVQSIRAQNAHPNFMSSSFTYQALTR
jgi:hypothetical protein